MKKASASSIALRYRNMTVLAAIFFGLWFIGCKKDKEQEGRATATINGETWQSTFTFGGYLPCNKGRLDLLLDGLLSGSNWTRSIHFSSFEPKPGELPVSPTEFGTLCRDLVCESVLFVLDDDLILASYTATGASEDFLAIDELNLTTGKIAGRFSVTYKKFGGSIGHPDTLRVKNAKFQVWMKP
jgi:hypothetical protein